MDDSVKAKMPAKNTNDMLEDEIQYCKKLIDFVETESGIAQVPKVLEPNQQRSAYKNINRCF